MYSRYISLGKELLTHGDRIEAERNFQLAEHYCRLTNMTNEQNGQRKAKNLEKAEGESANASNGKNAADDKEATNKQASTVIDSSDSGSAMTPLDSINELQLQEESGGSEKVTCGNEPPPPISDSEGDEQVPAIDGAPADTRDTADVPARSSRRRTRRAKVGEPHTQLGKIQ